MPKNFSANAGADVKPRTIFITGTDTGVGKTVLAHLLTRHLHQQGLPVAGLKPLCSGGRDDARLLHAAMDGKLTLEEINPWHFRAALSPLQAARKERRKVFLDEVVAHIRQIQKRFPLAIVEGAGGLLSPMGEDFDSRDLIRALKATPVVVAPNRLGVLNQLLLTLEALPPAIRHNARLLLMSPRRQVVVSNLNQQFLGEKLGLHRTHAFPWLKLKQREANREITKSLAGLAQTLSL
ncbi:MAG: dethiobiotin synthase [Verrucomicrobiota bacterium]